MVPALLEVPTTCTPKWTCPGEQVSERDDRWRSLALHQFAVVTMSLLPTRVAGLGPQIYTCNGTK